jgi:exonuclease III
MRIITFNLERGGMGEQHWSRVIGAFDPDIFLAQEAFPPVQCGLQGLSGQAYWHAADSAKYGSNKWGTAVFAKTGKVTELPIEPFRGWLVGVEIEGMVHPGLVDRPLRVFSLHAPSREITGESYEVTVKKMLDVVYENCGDTDVVIGGDFNLYSLGERHQSEQKDGQPWLTTKAEREVLAQLRDAFGLINCWQTANPDVPLVQTLRAKNSAGAFHCDGNFVPATWQSALESCDVVDPVAWVRQGKGQSPKSDHNPVVATFR